MRIRIRGLKVVRAKGRTYLYHRKTGKRVQADRSDVAAFTAELARLDAEAAGRAEAMQKSLGGLIGAYRESPEFCGLAPRTRQDYERVFTYLQPAADAPLFDIGTPDVIEMRDAAFKARKRRFANYALAVLSLLFAWGRLRGWLEANPADGVPMVKRPKDAPIVNRAWTAAELVTVADAAPPELRLAIALGCWTGLRQGDVLRLPWSAYNDGEIELRVGKTGRTKIIPVSPELSALLDEAAKRKTSPVIVTGVRGAPYTANGFRARFFQLVRRLEVAGAIGKGLTYHGLRHTLGARLADGGADLRTIQAFLGHATSTMAAHYSRGADERRQTAAAVVILGQKGN